MRISDWSSDVCSSDLTDDIYLWADYSKGFRAPSLTELFADGVHFEAPLGPGMVVINEFVPTPNLKAETSRPWQFGARLRIAGWFSEGATLSRDTVVSQIQVEDFVRHAWSFISRP